MLSNETEKCVGTHELIVVIVLTHGYWQRDFVEENWVSFLRLAVAEIAIA
jgi:hypothetical protein